jgi:DNA-binding NarL/FixJ family response regulator
MNPNILRILIADDNPAIRSALALLLETRLNATIVGEADQMELLLTKVARLQPDIVILDWELPGLPEKSRIAALRMLQPTLKVVVTSSRPEDTQQALTAQADSYVSKTQPPEQVVQAIQSINLSV